MSKVKFEDLKEGTKVWVKVEVINTSYDYAELIPTWSFGDYSNGGIEVYKDDLCFELKHVSKAEHNSTINKEIKKLEGKLEELKKRLR